ncbi:exosortase F system-associated membrane protein [Moheibacter sediminis]|uniref:Exosortase F-associated protein n=1 Tax=Moheibacter sediminis TaxID=1434700 RepID=A0A1W1ZK65_9FLAO|nr:exosortase F system-associated protein [Moheibacter sediminis]SMC48889.1 exosortase F-associated protein [Moheibacter sediminis]
MNKWLRYLLAAVLVVCLILVRGFEKELFYDPFLQFFKGDFINSEYPEYDLARVVLSVISRYLINTIISILIIGLIFWSRNYILFTSYIYAGFFLILLPIYIYFVETEFSLGENMGFYIRRFLIQPVLLLILIPAFYYQKYLAKKDTSASSE